MPRIIGIEIPGNKYVEYALRYLYGIGPAKALEIVERCNIPRDMKAKDLTPEMVSTFSSSLSAASCALGI